MQRRNNLSKSTKRRRLLDEKNYIKTLSHNDSFITLNSVELNNTCTMVTNPLIEPTTNYTDIDHVPHHSPSVGFDLPTNNVDQLLLNNDSTSLLLGNGDENVDPIEEVTRSRDIIEDIVQWALDQNIPNNNFDKLLNILRKHKCFEHLPASCRTLYKMYSGVSYEKPVEVQIVSPGIYYHFGVADNIKKYIDFNYLEDTIRLVIGVDGLPLSKSSGSCFWPILGYLSRQRMQSVFLIGIYWGNKKPDNSNAFIKYFVDEIKQLITNGINVKQYTENNILIDVHKKVTVDAFCCDQPAKSFLLNTKSHCGFYSCTRCTVKGKYLMRRVCFPKLNCSKRTHEDFVGKIQRQYHNDKHQVTEILNIPNFDVVNHFSIDYMHAVCLGAVKKILMLWKGDTICKRNINKQKLNSLQIKHISERLVSFRNSVPCEFARKPRSLEELPRFKATELRLILLYLGPLSIHSIVSKKIYKHFLSLNIAMTIFLSPNYNMLASSAKSIMNDFVKQFAYLYGSHFVSHNIHSLIHLYDDYNLYGPLDNVSCFKFENYMCGLKKMVRKNDKPLQQVVKRCQERSLSLKTNCENNVNNIPIKQFKVEHSEGPLTNETSSPQYKILILDQIKVKIHVNADSYVGLKTNGNLQIIKVVNICYCQQLKKQILLGRQFLKLECFFKEPIKSNTMGIYKVSDFSKTICIWNIEDVMTKYMILSPDNIDIMVAYPVIHFNN
ncbi:unnamed protein product [Macrosiphum euphorbiae]|uniref:Transposase domain-containing protein n=1 Tax=Macrosiphum euphorbiae TaxID=13131 RepID=A0AAV0YCY6_9HEMI|nr:unnamed protein product [Macrosiphum euphorbiae]